MKKGFGYYYKQSWSLLKLVGKKHAFIERFALAIYTFASFLCKGFIFTAPIFMIADHNLAKMIKETHDYNLTKAFDGVASKYKACLLSILAYYSIWFAFVAAFTLFFFVTGHYVPMMSDWGDFMFDFYNIYIAIILFAGLFILNVYTSVGYISANSSKLDVGDILYTAKRASKKSYGYALWTNFLYYFPFLAITLGFVMLGVFIIDFGGNPFPFTIPLQIVYAAIFFFYLMPSMLAKTIMLSSLYDDVADPQKSIVVKQVAGEEIQYEPLFVSEDEIEVLDLSKKEEK